MLIRANGQVVGPGWAFFMTGLVLGLRIAAIVLFLLAAVPPVPYSSSLVAVGLALGTASTVVP